VFAKCLARGWLAAISAELRGSGSALEVRSQWCAIKMPAFTLLHQNWRKLSKKNNPKLV